MLQYRLQIHHLGSRIPFAITISPHQSFCPKTAHNHDEMYTEQGPQLPLRLENNIILIILHVRLIKLQINRLERATIKIERLLGK